MIVELHILGFKQLLLDYTTPMMQNVGNYYPMTALDWNFKSPYILYTVQRVYCYVIIRQVADIALTVTHDSDCKSSDTVTTSNVVFNYNFRHGSSS